MGELAFALIEMIVELLCMGAAGRWILLCLITLGAIVGFGYWAYIS
ncbi:hypothetical protein XbC2_117 [Xanthomonas phage XbC2]|nr:hypothetical protein XbC2_117 [Xanthomonas phage XbC2]